MSRDELLALLSRLVADERLSESEAAGVLRRYDAGDLPSVAVPQPTAPQPSGGGLAGNSPEVIGANFDVEVQRRAAAVASGALSLTAWQAEMAQLVADEMMSQALLGSDGELTEEDIAEIEAEAEEQAAYVSRFADEMALAMLLGEPMSEDEIRARSELYGGASWAWYWKARGARQGLAVGIVVDYIAVDDKRTCGPCHSAEMSGPYLPSDGPWPGEICLGRGRCRCRREERYDLAAWQKLTGA